MQTIRDLGFELLKNLLFDQISLSPIIMSCFLRFKNFWKALWTKR